ncbi:MAG: DUF1194 domain-containing protein [Bauldia sp.]|nr:DUF1194 domain-containing protein [Bauldia sp.]
MKIAGVLAALLLASAPASAQSPFGAEVDLNLVVAIDVSESVNDIEWNQQKQGYIDAFLSEEVLGAILSGPLQRIGVMIIQCAGTSQQAVGTNWLLLEDEESAGRLADLIAGMRRLYYFSKDTSIAGCMYYGMSALDSSPFTTTREVIDLSGDGEHDGHGWLDHARAMATERQVIVNGIPILTDVEDLEQYYREFVITGAGSFTVVAKDFASFGQAIRRKFVLEIASNQ